MAWGQISNSKAKKMAGEKEEDVTTNIVSLLTKTETRSQHRRTRINRAVKHWSEWKGPGKPLFGTYELHRKILGRSLKRRHHLRRSSRNVRIRWQSKEEGDEDHAAGTVESSVSNTQQVKPKYLQEISFLQSRYKTSEKQGRLLKQWQSMRLSTSTFQNLDVN